jgi:hypothetical protein
MNDEQDARDEWSLRLNCKEHRDDGSISKRKFYFYCVDQAAAKPDTSDDWVHLLQNDDKLQY